MSSTLRTTRVRSPRGFTLIELLVVVLIILVLVGIVGGLGFKVLANQKTKVTQGVLQSLDRALEEYMVQNNGNIPPFTIKSNVTWDYLEVPGPNVAQTETVYFEVYPVGTGTVFYAVRPDAAVFLRQAMGYGQVQSIVSGLTERFLRLTTQRQGDLTGNLPDRAIDPTPSVVDAWAQDNWESPWDCVEPVESMPDGRLPLQQLIMYVHPKNLLAQEYYGKCVNDRPYFMSAGPDMLYGTKSEFAYIVARYGLTQGQFSPGESPLEFKQRVLKTAREDNLYSYPVKWDFLTDPLLLP